MVDHGERLMISPIENIPEAYVALLDLPGIGAHSMTCHRQRYRARVTFALVMDGIAVLNDLTVVRLLNIKWSGGSQRPDAKTSRYGLS